MCLLQEIFIVYCDSSNLYTTYCDAYIVCVPFLSKLSYLTCYWLCPDVIFRSSVLVYIIFFFFFSSLFFPTNATHPPLLIRCALQSFFFFFFFAYMQLYRVCIKSCIYLSYYLCLLQLFILDCYWYSSFFCSSGNQVSVLIVFLSVCVCSYSAFQTLAPCGFPLFAAMFIIDCIDFRQIMQLSSWP